MYILLIKSLKLLIHLVYKILIKPCLNVEYFLLLGVSPTCLDLDDYEQYNSMKEKIDKNEMTEMPSDVLNHDYGKNSENDPLQL